ncbi:hypothetical protein NQ317_018564 [Molorchus minor]|uniref:Uncharacterized protein n=1 Tax=Molorchus minor TaxID=1323400 RepID=A0ABQ9JYS9_9CUCU|nr:hypothetical protein NQ317_018564 [Molorchus minor]
MAVELSKEQLTFLEECNLEFSERFTDADLEYKKVYDLGIPPPPIVYPWWTPGRGRNFNRNRAGSSRYNNYNTERNNYQGNHRTTGVDSWHDSRRGLDNLYDDGEHRHYNDHYRNRGRNPNQESSRNIDSSRQHYRPY